MTRMTMITYFFTEITYFFTLRMNMTEKDEYIWSLLKKKQKKTNGIQASPPEGAKGIVKLNPHQNMCIRVVKKV